MRAPAGGYVSMDSTAASGRALCISDPAQIAGNAFYCPQGDGIVFDSSALVPVLLGSYGSAGLAAAFAHEFGHAVQAQVGPTPDDRRGHPDRPAQLGVALARQRVQDPGAALDPAPGLLRGFAEAGLGHDEGEERLGAHERPGQRGLQVVVDDPGQGGGVGSAVPGDPLVAFGAVLGDGAHQEQDLVDELGAGGEVEQLGQGGAVPGAFVGARSSRCPGGPRLR